MKSSTWLGRGAGMPRRLRLAVAPVLENPFNADGETPHGLAGLSRSAWHDNARFVGICLVVAGHWGVGRSAYPEVNAVAVEMIFSFHMALFVMLAGRFVKPGGAPLAVFRRSWGQLVLPLALFAALDLLLMNWLTGKAVAVSLYSIPYGLWFLASLFCWRLMVVPLGRWRTVDLLAGPLALVLLAASGVLPNVFSMVRTLAFFPTFLFGMAVLPKIEPALRKPVVRGLAGAGVGGGLMFVALQSNRIPKRWLHHDATYESLGNGDLRGAAIRVGLMAFGTVMAVGVVALVPSRNLGAVSRLGRYTLYAYLLHLPVTKVIRYWAMPNSDNSAVVAVAVTLAVIPFTLLAMSGPVRRLTQPMVEPAQFVNRP